MAKNPTFFMIADGRRAVGQTPPKNTKFLFEINGLQGL